MGFIIAFAFSFITALPLLFLKPDPPPDMYGFDAVGFFIPVCIFLSRLGITIVFTFCYSVQAECFPTTFQSFSFGIGACIAHLCAMASSIISETPPPIPMVVFEILCVIAFLFSFKLKIPENKEKLLQEILDIKTQKLAALPAEKKTIILEKSKTFLMKYQTSFKQSKLASFKASNVHKF